MVKLLRKKQTPAETQAFKGNQFEVNSWQLSELIVERVVPVVGVHPFPLNELLLMSGAVSWFRPKLIFEWGTHLGKSARVFYEVTEGLGLKTQIHSIDLPDEIEHGEHPREKRGEFVRSIKRVTLHQGDGLDTALSILEKRGSKLGNDSLFFIDGDHSYGSVRRELSGVIRQAPQAAILLHDTFYQSPESKYNIGPYKAIRDCLVSSKSKYKRIDTATGLPGMTLLYPL